MAPFRVALRSACAQRGHSPSSDPRRHIVALLRWPSDRKLQVQLSCHIAASLADKGNHD